MSVITRTYSSEILLQKVHNGIKGNRVPYMGCQSLLYQSKINKESCARQETCRSLDDSDFRLNSVPTSILIHQDSPQSIPSFSTFHSDLTLFGKTSSSNHTAQDQDHTSCIYDMPPNEHPCIEIPSRCYISESQNFPTNKIRKRPSLLKRQSKLSSNSSLNGNKNLLTLCVGSRSPTFKKSVESNFELPEAEHSTINHDSVFLSPPNSANNYQPINSWDQFFSSFSLKNDNEFFWTRNSLKKPLLTYVEKNRWKSAFKCFNVIQKYMGDRRTRKSPSELIAILIKHTSDEETLHDEILMQICRQTILNPDFRSRSRGWELLAECLVQFSPTGKLLPYLDGFLLESIVQESKASSPMNSSLTNLRKCELHLSRIRGVIDQDSQFNESSIFDNDRKRSFSDNIQFCAKESVSFFHHSLQTMMKQQSIFLSSEKVPIVLSTLCNQLAEDFEDTDSFTSLYRSMYNLSDLTKSVSKLDKWCCSICENGPHQVNHNDSPNLSTIALQVLIYWFENLSTPVISQQMAFMSNFSLDDLTKVNRRVVCFIAEFLKVHVISKSKDSLRNIASFLCTLIFQLPKDKFYPLEEPKDSVYMKIILNVFMGL